MLGNTDELLWRPDEHDPQRARAPKLAALLALLFDSYAPATRALLDDEHVAWLHRLSAQRRVGDWTILHAAPGDLWRAPRPTADAATLPSSTRRSARAL